MVVCRTYCSAGNGQLNLPSVRAHEHAELLYNTRKSTQPVVLGKCGQEVLDNTLLVLRSNVLLKLRNDLLLIRDGEGRGAENLNELWVLLEQSLESLERLRGGVKDVGFRSCRVLCVLLAAALLSSHCPPNSIPEHLPTTHHSLESRTRALAYVPSTPKRATGGLLAEPVGAAAA